MEGRLLIKLGLVNLVIEKQSMMLELVLLLLAVVLREIGQHLTVIILSMRANMSYPSFFLNHRIKGWE